MGGHLGSRKHTKLSICGSLLLGLLDDVGLVLVLLQPGIALADNTLSLRELSGVLCDTHDFDWVFMGIEFDSLVGLALCACRNVESREDGFTL